MTTNCTLWLASSGGPTLMFVSSCSLYGRLSSSTVTSSTPCGSTTVNSGGSLTGLTVIANVDGRLMNVSPLLASMGPPS